MGKYSRVGILVGLIMFPTLLFAQFNNNTSSPYSRYGMGDLQSYGFGRSVAMGGASIASRNHQQINLSNPASYTAIDSLVFMFEFGIDGRFTKISNDNGSFNTNNANFQYLAMKFQVSNKVGASLGLVPFSDIGYNVDVVDDIDNAGSTLTKYYGTGTVSIAYLGLAFEPFKNVSLGANLNYLFGKMNKNAEVYFLEASDFYQMIKWSDFRLRDFYFDFGAQVTIPLKNDKHVVLGAVLENKPKITTLYSDLTQKTLSSGNTIDRDTLSYVDETRSVINMPLTVGGGISFVKKDVYEINADYFYQGWSDAIFFGDKLPYLTDLNKFAVGAEWIPNKYSIRSFVSKIAYRGGFKYEKSYLELDGHRLKTLA